MYRSTSWYRFAGDYYMNSTASPGQPTVMRAYNPAVEGNELPMYVEPEPETAKKERRNKFAENAVHVIPLVLLLCALILWVFSTPESAEVKMRGDHQVPARVEGLTMHGAEIDTDSDGTQTSLLPVKAVDNEISRKHAVLGEDHNNVKGHTHQGRSRKLEKNNNNSIW